MSTTTAVPVRPPKKAPAPLTERQKKIQTLQDLKSKDKATEAQLDELKKLNTEERKATLVKLATRRVNKLIDSLRQIGNLGAYKPSEAQTKAVFGKIKEAVDAAYGKWAGNKSVEEGFDFPTE